MVPIRYFLPDFIGKELLSCSKSEELGKSFNGDVSEV